MYFSANVEEMWDGLGIRTPGLGGALLDYRNPFNGVLQPYHCWN